MNQTGKLLRYQLRNVTRGRAVLGYAAALLVISWGIVHFAGSASRALLSLGNVVLIVIPLMALVLGTVHFYESREFAELVLAHPVRRREVYRGLYLGLVVPMSAAFVVAVLLPLAMVGIGAESAGPLFALMVAGVFLTAIFIAIAFLIATRTQEPMKGLGTALGAWLLFAVVYDGIVLLAANALAAYPLERPMLALMMLNPVDLGRILLLMELDVAALMGYTGAVFRAFFGTTAGPMIAVGWLTVWIAGPLWLGMRAYDRKDL